jgi:hypothetical protein
MIGARLPRSFSVSSALWIDEKRQNFTLASRGSGYHRITDVEAPSAGEWLNDPNGQARFPMCAPDLDLVARLR